MDGLDLIRGSHAEGLRLLDSALTRDEEGDSSAALSEYRQALAVMAMGLEVRGDLSHCVGAEWVKARQMQQEMRKRGVQTRGRIKDLERLDKSGLLLSASSSTLSSKIPSDAQRAFPSGSSSPTIRRSPPPPYSETDEQSGGARGAERPALPLQPPPYSEFPVEPSVLSPTSPMTAAVQSPSLDNGEDHVAGESSGKVPNSSSTKARLSKSNDAVPECGVVEVTQELFRIDEGVRIFEVDPESGRVQARKSSSSSASSTATTTSLAIFKLPTPKNRQESFDCLEYILQVDDWIFPLSQHLSPILKTVDSIYMFPDLKEEASSVACLATERAIGLVLDPACVPLDVRFVFEEKLRELALLLTVDEAASLGLVRSASFSETDGAGVAAGAEGRRLSDSGVVTHHRVQPRGALAADFVARGMLTGASALSQGQN